LDYLWLVTVNVTMIKFAGEIILPILLLIWKYWCDSLRLIENKEEKCEVNI